MTPYILNTGANLIAPSLSGGFGGSARQRRNLLFLFILLFRLFLRFLTLASTGSVPVIWVTGTQTFPAAGTAGTSTGTEAGALNLSVIVA